MKNIFLMLCGIILFSSELCAQERFIDDVFKEVDESTHTYFEKENETLQLDVYQPQGDNEEARPLLLYVHGGGFSGGRRDTDGIKKFCRRMAAKGYVVASMSYTLVMKGQSFSCEQPAPNKIETFKLTGQDINRATRFMLKEKDNFKIASDKIVLLGSSAGAEAILHAGYWSDTRKDESGQIISDDFSYAGLISMAGALVSLDWISEKSAIPTQLFHGTCDNLVPYGVAPHHYCQVSDPGYLPLYGGNAIAERLKVLGKPYYLVTACQGKHEWAGKPLHNNTSEMTDFLYYDVLSDKQRQLHVYFDTGQDACPENYPEFNFCAD